jgi:hypothetical protein
MRRDARFASGEVVRAPHLQGRYQHPFRTLVSTELSEFRNHRPAHPPPWAALSGGVHPCPGGPAGRVDAGTINIVNRPIFGIEAVTNEGATFFGSDKETDEELRRRIKSTLERAGKSQSMPSRHGLVVYS